MYDDDMIDVVVAIAGTVVTIIVVALLFLAVIDIRDSNREEHARTAAFRSADVICHGRANAYDVQDQARIVYACEDGKLRTMTYGSGR